MGHTATYRSIDRGLLEWVGPTGLVRVGIRLTQQISNGQVYLPNYALIMVVFAGVFALAGVPPCAYSLKAKYQCSVLVSAVQIRLGIMRPFMHDAPEP